VILSEGRNFLIDRPVTGVWIARLTRPDMRKQLDGADSEDTALYRDLEMNLLPLLQPDNCFILNLGLVDHFPNELYQVLLLLRHFLVESRVRFIICNPSLAVMETIKLRRADQIFEMATTEEEAIRRARQVSGKSTYGELTPSRFG
jgi:anti-anti-sigma regulatory factor